MALVEEPEPPLLPLVLAEGSVVAGGGTGTENRWILGLNAASLDRSLRPPSDFGYSLE